MNSGGYQKKVDADWLNDLNIRKSTLIHKTKVDKNVSHEEIHKADTALSPYEKSSVGNVEKVFSSKLMLFAGKFGIFQSGAVIISALVVG